VPGPLDYQPYCPVGAALNAVGERWALLIVRDLLLGPRRYSELLRGLGGIGTDILAARLKHLQEADIVRQVGAGRARCYQLTDSGQALRPALIELARWGSERLQLPDDLSRVPLRVPLTAILVGAPSLPRKADGRYEIRIQDETLRVVVADGQVLPDSGGGPATRVTLTTAGLKALVAGDLAATIQKTGDVTIEGDKKAAQALLAALSRPPLLEGLRRRLTEPPTAASRARGGDQASPQKLSRK
jgi:DNA-binding HxlR family transcriptional regulator